MGVLIIVADGTRGQGLGLKLWSRDGDHQGLYQLGGEVGSGSRFLGRRNRIGREVAGTPALYVSARSGFAPGPALRAFRLSDPLRPQACCRDVARGQTVSVTRRGPGPVAHPQTT